jgi:hypothetical protein
MGGKRRREVCSGIDDSEDVENSYKKSPDGSRGFLFFLILLRFCLRIVLRFFLTEEWGFYTNYRTVEYKCVDC